jgi:hypothetical protein
MSKFLFLFSLIVLFSCNQYDYTLDFRKQEFPEISNYNKKTSDSLIKEDDHFMKIYESSGLFCTTDKKKYKVGDEVILTLENKTNDEIIYIFPSLYESKRFFFLQNEKEIKEIKSKLVSENPAIIGYSGPAFPNTNYFHLFVSGLNTKVAELLGLTGFDDALEPGEKITFKVYPPEQKGFYRFMFKRYVGKSIWGLGSFWCSNAFEIE